MSRRRLRDRLTVCAYSLLARVAQRIPARLGYPACDRLGDLLWLANRPARRAVAANLRRVIGSPGRRHRHAVRDAFRQGIRAYYDTLRLPALSCAELIDLVPLQGREHLDAALAAGRGAILVGAHLSGTPLGGPGVAVRGYPVHVVVEPVDPPALLDLFVRVRSVYGVRAVPLGPRLVPDLLAALRRNEVVALIVDRDVPLPGGGGSSVAIVPFFGAPARMPVGPALLAMRSGAPVLPALAVRRADDRVVGIIEPPISLAPRGDRRADVAAMTEAVAARLEYYIGRHPEQWAVFQPVWGEDVGA